MYQKVFIGILILGIVSCETRQNKVPDEIAETNINLITVAESKENKAETGEFAAFFSDDSRIGLPRKNKIEISEFKKQYGNFAVIKFYSLDENQDWKLKQTIEFEKNTFRDCDPQLEDFNNDGLKDITCVSNAAARGANELRRLFIYDRKKDELTYIKNSEDYPNLQYNKDLDCLDAWLFHGGVTTVFLKIDGDGLKEFAGIEHRDNDRTIYIIDKNGKEKLLRKDKIRPDDFYVRYRNYNPLTAYEQ